MTGIREKSGRLIAILLLVMTVATMVSPGFAFECTTATYDSAELKVAKSRFSPYEKVFVKIRCTDLDAGEHVVHVNWIHNRRGIIRSDKHTFKMDIKGDRLIFFWFKLSRKGPFSSAITNSDFHEENLGKWFVETYLEDKLAGTVEFEILPEG